MSQFDYLEMDEIDMMVSPAYTTASIGFIYSDYVSEKIENLAALSLSINVLAFINVPAYQWSIWSEYYWDLMCVDLED